MDGTRSTSKVRITDDLDVEKTLRVDGNRNLRTGFSFGLKFVSVTNPGEAYVNGVNALCLANPSSGSDQIRIVSISISSATAGNFYLAVAPEGTIAGATTARTFDLQGVRGEAISSTCDVVWAALMSIAIPLTPGVNIDCGAGNELYLIAPNVVYNLTITWIEEPVEA